MVGEFETIKINNYIIQMNYQHLIFSIICLLIIGYIYKKVYNYIETNERKDDIDLINKYLISENKSVNKLKTNNRPKIWLFLNNTINSQKWENFGSRNTNNLNKDYINLCISSIINKCGNDFDIMIVDVDSFKILLNDWNIDLNKLSGQLKKHFILIGLLKLLNKYGGIILQPSTIMFKSLLPLYNRSVNNNKPFTGQFKNESLDNYQRNLMPSIAFLGSNKNNEKINELINFIVSKISNDYSNEISLTNLINNMLYKKIIHNEFDYIDGKYLGIKDTNDRIIDLEDLMSDKFIDLDKKTYFLHIPDDELSKRTKYNWFIYLNKEEVLKSRTNIGKYLLTSYK